MGGKVYGRRLISTLRPVTGDNRKLFRTWFGKFVSHRREKKPYRRHTKGAYRDTIRAQAIE
jgi:hypothetical protein